MKSPKAPKPRPLSPQQELDCALHWVDRMVREGVRPTVTPIRAPKPMTAPNLT